MHLHLIEHCQDRGIFSHGNYQAGSILEHGDIFLQWRRWMGAFFCCGELGSQEENMASPVALLVADGSLALAVPFYHSSKSACWLYCPCNLRSV